MMSANHMFSSYAERKKAIFRAVVREYIRSAEPVGSATLLTQYGFSVSPATVRNDLAALEAEGLLEQPHPSAGRVPSELGYRCYVSERDDHKNNTSPESEHIYKQIADILSAQNIRQITRALSDASSEIVFASFENGENLVTGVTYFAAKPEGSRSDTFSAFARALDEIDVVAPQLYRSGDHVSVFIGTENPFGNSFSAITVRGNVREYGEGVIGILGPTRMNYDTNIEIMKHVQSLLFTSL